MKKKAVWMILAIAPALMAEYPRDAAARFKMKNGIDHPVVVAERRAAELARLKQSADPQNSKAVEEAATDNCLLSQTAGPLTQELKRPCDRAQ